MNAARVKHLEQVRQLYRPSPGTLTANLPAMGESLNNACNGLASDCTVVRVDELVARLETAKQALTRLRVALLAGGAP